MDITFPNESPEYRAARNELLVREAALRREIEGVAAAIRALPPGGPFPRTIFSIISTRTGDRRRCGSRELFRCQPALKRDPLSAPKRDPSRWLGERAWRAGACRLRRRVRRVSGVEGRSGAVLEAPALVAGLNDVAVVSEPVEERGGHLGVAEDAWPFPEREVGRDDH